MTTLKVSSPIDIDIRPLLEGALENELRILETGIRRTQKNLYQFEIKYKMDTQNFISSYENDEFEETMDTADWIGEYRMLERLNEKADTLKSLKIEN
jgi:hypothetical protein